MFTPLWGRLPSWLLCFHWVETIHQKFQVPKLRVFFLGVGGFSLRPYPNTVLKKVRIPPPFFRYLPEVRGETIRIHPPKQCIGRFSSVVPSGNNKGVDFKWKPMLDAFTGIASFLFISRFVGLSYRILPDLTSRFFPVTFSDGLSYPFRG